MNQSHNKQERKYLIITSQQIKVQIQDSPIRSNNWWKLQYLQYNQWKWDTNISTESTPIDAAGYKYSKQYRWIITKNKNSLVDTKFQNYFDEMHQ